MKDLRSIHKGRSHAHQNNRAAIGASVLGHGRVQPEPEQFMATNGSKHSPPAQPISKRDLTQQPRGNRALYPCE